MSFIANDQADRRNTSLDGIAELTLGVSWMLQPVIWPLAYTTVRN